MIKFAKPHTINTGIDSSSFNQLPMSNLININAGKNNSEALEKVGIFAAIAAFAGTAVAWVGKWFNKKQDGINKKAAIETEKNAKLELMREEARLKQEQLDKEHEIWEKEQERKLNDFIEKEKIKNQTPSQAPEEESNGAIPQNDVQPTKPEIPDARFSRGRITPTNFLVPRLISEGEIATIYGHEKIGKSYLGAQIAKDLTIGGASTLFPKEAVLVPKCHVFYYSAENWKDNLENRLPDGFLDDYQSNFHLLEVDGYNVGKLVELIKYQITADSGSFPILIIIDNLSGIVDNVYSGEIDEFMSELISIKKDANTRGLSLTIILFAHDKADKDLASAQSVGRKVSTIIRFSESDKCETERIIEIVRSNLHQKDRFVLQFREETKLHFEHVENNVELKDNAASSDSSSGFSSKEEQQIEKGREIRAWLNEDKSRTQSDAAQEFGVTRQTIINYLNRLKKTEEV